MTKTELNEQVTRWLSGRGQLARFGDFYIDTGIDGLVLITGMEDMASSLRDDLARRLATTGSSAIRYQVQGRADASVALKPVAYADQINVNIGFAELSSCTIMASELRLEMDGVDFPNVRGARTWVERVKGEPVRAVQFDYYVPADRPLDVDFEERVARGSKHELRLTVASGATKGASSVASGVFESATMGYDDDQRTRHAQTGAEPMVQRVVFRGSWAPFASPKSQESR